MGRLSNLFRPTKRSRDDQSLDSAQFVMSFIEHMVVPLFVLDREGKVMVWNEVMREAHRPCRLRCAGHQEPLERILYGAARSAWPTSR